MTEKFKVDNGSIVVLVLYKHMFKTWKNENYANLRSIFHVQMRQKKTTTNYRYVFHPGIIVSFSFVLTRSSLKDVTLPAASDKDVKEMASTSKDTSGWLSELNSKASESIYFIIFMLQKCGEHSLNREVYQNVRVFPQSTHANKNISHRNVGIS